MKKFLTLLCALALMTSWVLPVLAAEGNMAAEIEANIDLMKMDR